MVSTRALLAFAAAVCLAASARAETMVFTGVANSGALLGQTLSGYITYSPSMQPSVVSQTSQAVLAGFETPAGATPFAFGELTTSGGVSVAFGNVGATFDYGAINIVKRPAPEQNNFLLQARSYASAIEPATSYFSISVYDSLGASSMLFSEPGFALDQPVNLAAPGLTISGTFGGSSQPYAFASFTVTSAHFVSAVPELPPATLFAVGALTLVAGLRWRALRQDIRQHGQP